jgi:CRISPR-associated protein Csx10
VRGGLATFWLQGRCFADLDEFEAAQFRRLFLNDNVRFENALPLDPDSRKRGHTLIVPRTAQSQKDNPGWRYDQVISERGAGVCDLLPDLLRPAENVSPKKWEGWDRFDGEFANVKRDDWSAIRVQRRLLSRVAIGHYGAKALLPRRGVARDGQLYSLEVLDTGQQFQGYIRVPDDGFDYFQALFRGNQPIATTCGQGRSRGLGQVKIALGNEAALEARSVETLVPWIREFSTHAEAPQGKLFLPITLESDMLLRDNYLLPCSSGNPKETLGRYKPLTGTTVQMQLCESVQRTRWIGGWDALRNIPRPPRLAVQHGSVWVYCIQDDPQPLQNAIQWWLEAEQAGLGERRNEGFGRVQLLHPFHKHKDGER